MDNQNQILQQLPEKPVLSATHFKPQRRFKVKPVHSFVLLLLLTVFGAGVLALTQRALKESQETRSDAATGDPITANMGFMSNPAAGGTPQGLTSIVPNPSGDTTVSIWMNNPYNKEITAATIFIEYDPAIIADINAEAVPLAGATPGPETLFKGQYQEGTKKVEVLKIGAACNDTQCFPLTGAWRKLAVATFSLEAGATANTQLKILVNGDDRSIILAKDLDQNLLMGGGGYQTLNVLLDGTAPTTEPSITQPGDVLGKVTGLVATPYCVTSRVQLNWTPLANAQGYQIQHCKGASCTNWTNLETNFAETIYVHTGLTAGLHRYKVRGKNAAGVGAYSDVKQARIEAICPGVTPTITITPALSVTPSPTQTAGDRPAKVTQLEATPVCTAQKVEISWLSVANATSYQIQHCKGAGCTTWSNLSTNFTETVYTHSNLTAGLHRYRVRGKNAAGVGAYSDISQARILATCPEATPTATLVASTPTPTTPLAPTEEPTATQTPVQLAGDFNQDGNVNLAELQRVMDAYGQTGNVPENVNTDNEVNLLDVTIVLANFIR